VDGPELPVQGRQFHQVHRGLRLPELRRRQQVREGGQDWTGDIRVRREPKFLQIILTRAVDAKIKRYDSKKKEMNG
jgi:hypothetical protein